MKLPDPRPLLARWRPRFRHPYRPLLVVTSVALVAAVGFVRPKVHSRLEHDRDARRLRDIALLQQAIDAFHQRHGRLPQATPNATVSGWDVSNDGGFLDELVREGLLESPLRDPINDELHHYRYLVHAPGTWGCSTDEPYYVLGLRTFETRDFAELHRGSFRCPGRSWTGELAYVVGGPVAAFDGWR